MGIETDATTLPAAVEGAIGRLSAAIVRLQAAAQRGPGTGRADRTDELALMQNDRARIAAELDAALARAERLQRAQTAVAERLERAEAAVAAALGRIKAPAEQEAAMHQPAARAVGEAR